jgi:hypothetical protein
MPQEREGDRERDRHRQWRHHPRRPILRVSLGTSWPEAGITESHPQQGNDAQGHRHHWLRPNRSQALTGRAPRLYPSNLKGCVVRYRYGRRGDPLSSASSPKQPHRCALPCPKVSSGRPSGVGARGYPPLRVRPTITVLEIPPWRFNSFSHVNLLGSAVALNLETHCSLSAVQGFVSRLSPAAAGSGWVMERRRQQLGFHPNRP